MSATEMHCDLCGGQAIEAIAHKDRHGKPLDTGICLGCGLVMHLPVPSEEQVAEYYARHYRRDYHGEQRPSARRIMRAWRNAQRIHSQLEPWLGRDMRVFEVGAGIGCTVKYFERRGMRARGIEPNRDFNAFTRECLHAEVTNRNLFELAGERSEQLVLLIHVIEHFVSPTRALLHIRELLADDGMLYIECPNLTGPFATRPRMFHFAHIHNFTPETLRALAAKCGFEMVANFRRAHEPNIEMLFRKRAKPLPMPDLATHAERVKAAIDRYNILSYHLRPHYLAARARKLAGYAAERLWAKRFVTRLLEELARR
ncbi:MAG: class I SAM-dependent methyltransferase [Zetaproteobacteria bacterium]|nr:MAG: class I SAM-dependent methyltransferase [Zetaproteobacteria bacterium]